MILRLTCKEHENLYQGPATDPETPESDTKRIPEEATRVLEAHRAHYGAHCNEPVQVEVFDDEDEDSVVLLVKKRTGGYPEKVLGVFYDQHEADRYLETRLDMYSHNPDEPHRGDFESTRMIVVKYHTVYIDKPGTVYIEPVFESAPEPEPAGAGG